MLEQFINQYGISNGLIFLAIILIAYVSEEASVIGAAFAASNNYLALPVSIFATLFGLMSGSLALYYLGSAAHRWKYLKNKIDQNKLLMLLEKQLNNNGFMSVFIARFAPGIRTFIFTLCGYYKTSLLTFIAATFVASSVWVGVIFYSVYQLGASDWFDKPINRLTVLLCSVIIFYLINLASKKFLIKN